MSRGNSSSASPAKPCRSNDGILLRTVISLCVAAALLGAVPGAMTTTPATRTVDESHNDAVARFQRLAKVERGPEPLWDDAIRKVRGGDHSPDALADLIDIAG